MNDFDIQYPETFEQLLKAAAVQGSHVLAGGTDVVTLLRDRLLDPRLLVSVRKVPGLDRIQVTGGDVHVGARVTLAMLAADATIRQVAPALAQAADSAATQQVRNAATIGGNLCQRPRCWYFRGEFHCLKKGGDTCFAENGENQRHAIIDGGPCHIVFPSDPATALLALDARLKLRTATGSRELPIEQFFQLPSRDVTRENALAPGELIEEVVFSAPPSTARSLFHKVSSRSEFSFALVSAAVLLGFGGGRVQSARVALGGVSPVPHRSTAAEQALAGQRFTPDLAHRAAQAALSKARPLARNGYKVQMAANLLEQTLMEAAAAR